MSEKVSKEIMEYLAKAEGKTIHFLDGEKDITSPYGIYKGVHRDAEVFKIIEEMAKRCGVSKFSKEYTETDIITVNQYMFEKSEYVEKIYKAASEFYYVMSKPAKLEYLPKASHVAMFSLYINSPKNACVSAQMAHNKLVKLGLIDSKILVEDGALGPASAKAFQNITEELGLIFESYLLLSMSSLYAKLAVQNSDRFLKYLNGWNNRLGYLAEI